MSLTNRKMTIVSCSNVNNSSQIFANPDRVGHISFMATPELTVTIRTKRETMALIREW